MTLHHAWGIIGEYYPMAGAHATTANQNHGDGDVASQAVHQISSSADNSSRLKSPSPASRLQTDNSNAGAASLSGRASSR
jgi:hypothetical protein